LKGPNAIDPSEEPLYDDYNRPFVDLEYSNPNLLAGDEFGGPVGSFLELGSPGTPPPTPTPIPLSSDPNWHLYDYSSGKVE
jgi:hypothetical protein